MLELADLKPLIPEMFVLGMACVVLIADLFVSERGRGVIYALTQFTLIGAAVLTGLGFTAERTIGLFGTFVGDPLSDTLKLFVYGVTFLVLLYSRDYIKSRALYRGEFFVLVLTAVLGMMVLISGNSFLTLYLGLELLSLSLYALVALRRDVAASTEAAIKYFVLGALASGILLYGMSLLYGATGTLQIHELAAAVAADEAEDLVLLFGTVFIVVGLAFKLGAVPFHMWVPDVYQGAPTAVTLFLGTAPKIAAFAITVRLLIEGLEGLIADWQGMLVILAVLSMAVGNILAIAQSNIKRMLAYSTISHVGFLLLGILSGTEAGYAAAMFYTLAYVLMSLGGFGMIILLSRSGFEAERLEDFKGLNARSPWFALMMLIVMFSMAGVPPFLGFWAKLSVLQAAVAADLVWLAIAGVVFAIIGAFYYLRVIKLMYFDEPEDKSALQAAGDMRVALSANGVAVLVLGLFPETLRTLCLEVVGGLL